MCIWHSFFDKALSSRPPINDPDPEPSGPPEPTGRPVEENEAVEMTEGALRTLGFKDHEARERAQGPEVAVRQSDTVPSPGKDTFRIELRA
jgi:hypothetical protein